MEPSSPTIITTATTQEEVLLDAARRVEDGKAWYEALDLRWESLQHDVAVHGILTFNAENGRIDEASMDVLTPVLTVFKGLFGASDGAAGACEELVQLVHYSVTISRCFLQLIKAADTPLMMIMTLGEFKGEIERVRTFVEMYNTNAKEDSCGKSTLSSRDCAIAAEHKVKLHSLLNAVLDGFPSRLETNDVETEAEGRRRRLTFVSHAGEDKEFVRSLLKAIEELNVATFFDDDMALGTSSVDEMKSRAAEADQAIVVLSRPFLTKKWPMRELNIFLNKGIKIHPLYYRVTPDELRDIMSIYNRYADGDCGFRLEVKDDQVAWRAVMDEIGGAQRREKSTSVPDARSWQQDIVKLAPLTGLRFETFEGDEQRYAAAVARIVSPPRLPNHLPALPAYFVKPPLVGNIQGASR